MKFNCHGRIFQVAAFGLLTLCQMGALTGCVSASLEDAAPASALTAPAAPPAARPAAGARVAGEYPNLNIPPDSAATPITAAEKENLTRDLTATRERLGDGAPSGNPQTELQRLRRLAKTHAQKRLEEIESGR